MSWVNDLASSLGIPAGAATLAAAMYAACAAAEKAARPEALKDIGRILKDPTWSRSVRPSAMIERVFIWTFGERHWSWKCARRSMAGTVAFSVIACFAFSPIVAETFVMLRPMAVSLVTILGLLIGVLVVFLVSGLLPDYLALWKTRVLIRMQRRHQRGLIAIPVFDFLLSIAVGFLCSAIMWESFFIVCSFAGVYFNATGSGVLFDYDPGATVLDVLGRSNDLGNWWKLLSAGAMGAGHALIGHVESVRDLLLISTIFTSIWTVLIFASVSTLKLLAPIQRFTSWFFNVDTHPVRAIGIVSGALVMIGSLIWTVVRAIV